MRLVRCPGRVHLDRTNNPFVIASYQKDRIGVRCGERFPPPAFSALDSERREKTHSRPRLDSVYQKLSERS
jgi:hypothetical protein